ncbi:MULTISPECIES: hypothetical protein [Geomicrobium]|uniref:Uncharacterized protein n=1 Tax=Geomicrobium sediminis TaxID=1347788 RepID=A0ABS2P9J4_9BACL|nr:MULTISPECIES: hypothetical protein [Geomicrobium]EZH66069.1 hypothetical protein DH09_14705 [Bacillaceae bacterium JMAK1]MBM7631982.1 hypothetical protein [Geomicrobium sediminis]GAK08559.1 hypothetical protein JCM19038_2344 [Geomicrobium sp. JCM 19038]
MSEENNYLSSIVHFFSEFPEEPRVYSFFLDGVFHWMESDYIIGEILISSEEDLKEVHQILMSMTHTEESIHRFLELMAKAYVMAR